MPQRSPVSTDHTGLQVITEEECLALLSGATLGRVAVSIGALPVVLPVNFAVVDGTIVIRTAEGSMIEEAHGAGQFTSVTLHPRVTLAPGSDVEKAKALHHTAHEMCFIARSVNFPVEHEPTIVVAQTGTSSKHT